MSVVFDTSQSREMTLAYDGSSRRLTVKNAIEAISDDATYDQSQGLSAVIFASDTKIASSIVIDNILRKTYKKA